MRYHSHGLDWIKGFVNVSTFLWQERQTWNKSLNRCRWKAVLCCAGASEATGGEMKSSNIDLWYLTSSVYFPGRVWDTESRQDGEAGLRDRWQCYHGNTAATAVWWMGTETAGGRKRGRDGGMERKKEYCGRYATLWPPNQQPQPHQATWLSHTRSFSPSEAETNHCSLHSLIHFIFHLDNVKNKAHHMTPEPRLLFIN